MRCIKAKVRISEYIDGDLGDRKAAALKRHLSECPGCRRIYDDLRRIVDSAGRAADPVPPPDSWTALRARLDASALPGPERLRLRSIRRARGFRLAAAAATLVLVFTGGMLLGPGILNRNPVVFSLPNHNEYTLSKLEEAESHYQRAIRALAEAVESRDGKLNPQLAEVFRANLALVNASIETCKQAVTSDPTDLESRKFLLAAYRDKADLLNRIININGGPSRAGKDTTI